MRGPLDSADNPFEAILRTLEKTTNETQKREAFITLAARGFGESELATELALGRSTKFAFDQAGFWRSSGAARFGDAAPRGSFVHQHLARIVQ